MTLIGHMEHTHSIQGCAVVKLVGGSQRDKDAKQV